MTDQKNEQKAKKATTDESNDPAHTVREGAIAASIWLRQSPSGFPYYDFTLSRSWKSMSTGRTGYSKSFFDRNKAELLNVIELAVSWIEEHSKALAKPDDASSSIAA